MLCSTATTSYVRDPQGTLIAARIGTEELYYAFDGLGSVIALINASGTHGAEYTYDPYGANATATALNGALLTNPWRYAGGHLDTTGLYKYRARYYDPNIGRWTQQDSLDALGDPANANRYAYAGDNPVNNVDPSGREFLGIDCPLGETNSGGCNGASREAIGTGLAAAGTAAGIAAIPFSGGTSLALSAASIGLGTAGAGVKCGAGAALAAGTLGVFGSGVAGAFAEGGAAAGAIATNLGVEAAGQAIC